jgi:large-conductance mechanosensitive channel
MSSWAKEFKDFINSGNVVDLAAVVIVPRAWRGHRVVRRRHPHADHRRDLRQSDFSNLTIDIGDKPDLLRQLPERSISFLTIAFAVFLVEGLQPVQEAGGEAAGSPRCNCSPEIRDVVRRALSCARARGAPHVGAAEETGRAYACVYWLDIVRRKPTPYVPLSEVRRARTTRSHPRRRRRCVPAWALVLVSRSSSAAA